ncbi:MAG: hypothetical protein Q8Q12_00545 [bacterium]|nr:hypothetical protein [bacterium]
MTQKNIGIGTHETGPDLEQVEAVEAGQLRKYRIHYTVISHQFRFLKAHTPEEAVQKWLTGQLEPHEAEIQGGYSTSVDRVVDDQGVTVLDYAENS